MHTLAYCTCNHVAFVPCISESPLTECINICRDINCVQYARRQHVFYVDLMGKFVLVYHVNVCVAADAAHTMCETH